MRRRYRIKRFGLGVGLVFLALLVVGWWWTSFTREGQATYNVVEHHVTEWAKRNLASAAADPLATGSISGTVCDEQGTPLEGATVVVSTRQGETVSTHSRADGRYTLEGVQVGWVVPAAILHGYRPQVYRLAPWQQTTPVRVRADTTTPGVDFGLEPTTLPALLPQVERWEQVPVSNAFPELTTALRTRVTFERQGYQVTSYIYEPLWASETEDELPTVVAVFPSDPLNWEPASVAFVTQGYLVLGVGPVSMRDLDVTADTEDLRLAMVLLHEGKLDPRVDRDRIVALGGSFSSMALMRVMHDAPYVRGVVLMGGLTDAYLLRYDAYHSGYAGYSVSPTFEYAMWSLGRPDRRPRMYIENSGAFNVQGLPPVCIIHGTGDAIIPYNQSERLAEALRKAGQPYELHIYKDTDHYPGVQDPSPATQAMYWEMVRFFAQQLDVASP